jgi:hypothetical protein
MIAYKSAAASKALHLRWHVKKGRRVVGCVFCGLPTESTLEAPANTIPKAAVADSPQEPTTQSQPVVPSEEAPPNKETSLEQLQLEIQRQDDRNKFRNQVWAHVTAGLSPDESALLLGLQIPMLVGMVEKEFGTIWPELVRKARLDARQRCVTAALKAAENGDTRLLLKLKESGYSLWTEEDANAGRKLDYKKLTDEELIEFLIARLSPPGILKWKDRMNQPGSTITMRDATPEEIAEFKQSGSSTSGFSRDRDYDGHQIPTSEPRQLSEVQDRTVNEVKQIPPASIEDTPTFVQEVIEEAIGKPVTYVPESGLPLFSAGNDRRLS